MLMMATGLGRRRRRFRQGFYLKCCSRPQAMSAADTQVCLRFLGSTRIHNLSFPACSSMREAKKGRKELQMKAAKIQKCYCHQKKKQVDSIQVCKISNYYSLESNEVYASKL